VKLCCPKCKSETLGEAPDSLVCDECGSRYPAVGSVVDFSLSEPGPKSPERSQMQLIADAAFIKPWRKALRDHFQRLPFDEYRRTVSENQGAWTSLAPLTSASRTLVVGSRWGDAAFCMAEVCDEVVFMDAMLEKARFVAERARQDNVAALKAICASIPQHPFVPGQFDVVVAVASGQKEHGSPKFAVPDQIIEAASAQFRSLLRQGGWLVLAVQRTQPDHSPVQGSDDGRLRSPDEYETILSSVGFADIRFAWAYPGLGAVKVVVPLGEPSVNEYAKRVLLSVGSPGPDSCVTGTCDSEQQGPSPGSMEKALIILAERQ